MSFTTSSFVGKLAKLSDSQQSIQTLSHWVQYHKSSCNESAVTWAQECLRAPPARHLLYVYLANDIMQNSKRKGNEFCNAYGAQLPAVLPKMYAGASEEVKSKMLKVVKQGFGLFIFQTVLWVNNPVGTTITKVKVPPIGMLRGLRVNSPL